MYIIGFCDSLIDMLYQYVDNFDGIVGLRINDVRLVGCLTLVAILALAIVGMDWVTRVSLKFKKCNDVINVWGSTCTTPSPQPQVLPLVLPVFLFDIVV